VAARRVNTLAFSPDSRTLAAGSSVHGVLLWDVASGRPPGAMGEQYGRHQHPTFSPDGRTLAAIGPHEVVRLWHVATRRELFPLCHTADVKWAIRFDSPHHFFILPHPHGEGW